MVFFGGGRPEAYCQRENQGFWDVTVVVIGHERQRPHDCILTLIAKMKSTYIDSHVTQLRPAQSMVHIVLEEIIFWKVRDIGLLDVRDVRRAH